MRAQLLALALLLGSCSAQTATVSTLFGMQMNNNHYATLDDKLPDGITNYPLPVIPIGSVRIFDCNEGFSLSPKQGCHWLRVEPNATGSCSPATPCWTVIDHYLHELQSLGVTDAMYDLGEQTPTWAENAYQQGIKCGSSGFNCWPPADIAVSCTHVDNTGDCDGHYDGTDQTWRNWVATVSQHFVTMQATYGVHLEGYELWNEFQRGPGTGTSTAWEFGGTAQQMRRLAQDARCIIHGSLNPAYNSGLVYGTNETCAQVLTSVGLSSAVDSTALMLSPSIFTSAANAGPQLTIANNYFNSSTNTGALAAADVVAAHTYSGCSGCTFALAEKVWQDYNTLVGNLTNPGVAAKITWSTEGNYSGWYNLGSLEMESGYTAKIYILLASLGFVRHYLYGYDYNSPGSTTGGEGALWIQNQTGGNGAAQWGAATNYGAGSDSFYNCVNTSGVPANGCLMPSYLTVTSSGNPYNGGGPGKAYQFVASWLGGAIPTSPCATISGTAENGVWNCNYTLASGVQAQVVWNSGKICTNGGSCTTATYPAVGNLPATWTQYSDVYGNVTAISGPTTIQVGYNPILLASGAAGAIQSPNTVRTANTIKQ